MRHLLSTKDLSYDAALTFLDTADQMAAVGQRSVKKLPALRGRTGTARESHLTTS